MLSSYCFNLDIRTDGVVVISAADLTWYISHPSSWVKMHFHLPPNQDLQWAVLKPWQIYLHLFIEICMVLGWNSVRDRCPSVLVFYQRLNCRSLESEFRPIHAIHVWYICIHLPWTSINKPSNVGKYTMDGMGECWSCLPGCKGIIQVTADLYHVWFSGGRKYHCS